MRAGCRLTGEGGFLPEMIKAVLERRVWQAELTDHLGYEKGDPAGRACAELAQRVDAEDGADRGRRRRAGRAAGPGRHVRAAAGAEGRNAGSAAWTSMIISLYAGGMTVRDIQAPPGTHVRHRAVPRDDLQDHRRGRWRR